MIGFRSVQHQGHAAAKTSDKSGPPLRSDDTHNPYPRGCQSFYEYQDGCNAYRRGDVIDIRGNIVSPTAQTKRHAPVHRQGMGY